MKFKIQFLNLTCHNSSAQQSQVANGCHTENVEHFHYLKFYRTTLLTNL